MNSSVIVTALVIVLTYLAIASCVEVEAGKIGARAGNAIERSVVTTGDVRGLWVKGDSDGR